MTEGEVVLAVVPQSDLQTKRRPVIVLREMPPFRDLLVCGVSSQTHHRVPGFDEIISPADSDFEASGLRTESLIRLGFLTVLSRRGVLGAVGSISSERHRRLLSSLGQYLMGERETSKT